MGSKGKRRKKLSRLGVRKLRKQISATIIRYKGLFTTQKCTYEHSMEHGASTSQMEVCVVKQELDIGPTVLQRHDIHLNLQSTIKTEPSEDDSDPSEQKSVKSEPNELDIVRPAQDCYVEDHSPAVQCEDCGQYVQNRSELQQHKCFCNISSSMERGASTSQMEVCVVKQELDIEPTVLQRLNLQSTIKTEPSEDDSEPSQQKSVKSEPNELDIVRPAQDCYVEDDHSPAVQCEDCGQYVQNRYELQQHKCFCNISRDMRNETAHDFNLTPTRHNNDQGDKQGNEDYASIQCENRESQESDLTKHSNSDKRFKCPQCEYHTYEEGKLITHLREHYVKKPFNCTLCKYRTHKKIYLISHLKMHAGDKWLKCTRCEYSASNKISLNAHIITHTGDNLFKCAQCEYSTLYKSSFTRHMRVHTGNKPFKCTQCEYSAAHKHLLMVHVKKHTG